MIRSQDKTDLFKINRLKIREHVFANGEKEYFILNNNSMSDVVGIYKTKERALEILDEIQRYFNSFQKYFLKAKSHNLVNLEKAKRYFEDLNDIDLIVDDSNFEILPTGNGNCDVIIYEMPKE